MLFRSALKIIGGSSSSAWPVIAEDVQERCLKRVSARVRFIEGLSAQQQTQATADAVGDHPEQQLLACGRR